MRIRLHYLGMMLVIPVYGTPVCPFVESLSFGEIFATIGGMLLVAYFARQPLLIRVAHRGSP